MHPHRRYRRCIHRYNRTVQVSVAYAVLFRPLDEEGAAFIVHKARHRYASAAAGDDGNFRRSVLAPFNLLRVVHICICAVECVHRCAGKGFVIEVDRAKTQIRVCAVGNRQHRNILLTIDHIFDQTVCVADHHQLTGQIVADIRKDNHSGRGCGKGCRRTDAAHTNRTVLVIVDVNCNAGRRIADVEDNACAHACRCGGLQLVLLHLGLACDGAPCAFCDEAHRSIECLAVNAYIRTCEPRAILDGDVRSSLPVQPCIGFYPAGEGGDFCMRFGMQVGAAAGG